MDALTDTALMFDSLWEQGAPRGPAANFVADAVADAYQRTFSRPLLCVEDAASTVQYDSTSCGLRAVRTVSLMVRGQTPVQGAGVLLDAQLARLADIVLQHRARRCTCPSCREVRSTANWRRLAIALSGKGLRPRDGGEPVHITLTAWLHERKDGVVELKAGPFYKERIDALYNALIVFVDAMRPALAGIVAVVAAEPTTGPSPAAVTPAGVPVTMSLERSRKRRPARRRKLALNYKSSLSLGSSDGGLTTSSASDSDSGDPAAGPSSKRGRTTHSRTTHARCGAGCRPSPSLRRPRRRRHLALGSLSPAQRLGVLSARRRLRLGGAATL